MISETFRKFVYFIEICEGKHEKDLTFDEVMSMFMSSFTGEELIKFREAQNVKVSNNRK